MKEGDLIFSMIVGIVIGLIIGLVLVPLASDISENPNSFSSFEEGYIMGSNYWADAFIELQCAVQETGFDMESLDVVLFPPESCGSKRGGII